MNSKIIIAMHYDVFSSISVLCIVVGFVRCLLLCVCVCVRVHSDGFRKVMHFDTGIVKQERDGPVEFQHPYFKHGQDDLLENIKRKVESSLLSFSPHQQNKCFLNADCTQIL